MSHAMEVGEMDRAGQQVSGAEKFDLERLREALSAERARRRMSQEDIAAAIGCSRKWVSRFERGLSVPSFENVLAYAAMFGIGIVMMMPDGAPDMDRPSKVPAGD